MDDNPNIVIDIIKDNFVDPNNDEEEEEDQDQAVNTPLTDSTISSNTRQKYSLEDTLKKMKKYRWLHKSSSEYYDRLNSKITTPTILFSAITTVLTVASINPVVLAAVAGISTTLLGISTYLKLDSKHTSHLISAEGYDNLVTMIDFEIKFPDEEIKKFASSIEKKILEIKKSSRYLLPDFIYQKFLKRKYIIENS